MSATPKTSREQFKTGFGVLMTMVGAAVGLGNLWRFPYMVGMFGGGAFVFCYLIIIVLVGLPIMMVEWAAGRSSRRGPLGFFKASGIKGGKFFGWLNTLGLVMSLSVYSVVIGWAVYYAVASVSGQLKGQSAGDLFNSTLLGSPVAQYVTTAIVVILVSACCMFGLQKGLERLSKYGMPILFVIMIVIAVRVITLDGALEGLSFYLVPDFSKITPDVVLAGMGQAFFSLCLGGTFMVILGSYMRDSDNLMKTSVKTAIGDTCAGLLAGFMILPAAYAFGIQVDSGPNLMFITVPEIFKQIPGGLILCFLFFVLVIIAAYLSDASGYEVIIATMVDEFKMERKKSVIIFAVVQLLLAIPAVLSLNYLLAVDQLFGSTLQPICSMLVLIAYLFTLPKLEALKELNKGSDKPTFPNWLYYWTKFGVPVCIILVFGLGLKDFLAMIL